MKRYRIYCGLKDLSSQGLFHGDLSLKNVMVDTKGKVKLIDYGLSNIQGDNIFATPGYMAPELEDTREPNLASDLFSLGVIAERLGLTATIYKSLTSEHVFDRFEFLDELKVQSKPYRLGCKVHEVLNNSRTQNTKILVKAKASPIVQRAICLGAILTISLLSVSSSVHSRLMPEGAWVSIITSEWAKINTAGQELGYTPIYSKFFPAGKHLINWKTAHGSGKMALTIRPNKNIVLDDAALGIHSIRGHTGAH